METHSYERTARHVGLAVDAKVADGQSVERSFVALGLSIAKSIRALVGIKLAPLGVVVGQDQLLTALDTKAICVSDLAQTMCVRPSTVSKMVDRLVEKGLVERISHTSDQRRTLVRLTDSGLAIRKKILDVWDQVEDDLAVSLDASDRRDAMQGIASFDDVLTRRLNRLR